MELLHKYDRKSALAENKRLQVSGNNFRWKPGDTRQSFDTEEAVIEAAKAWYEKNANPEDLLCEGPDAHLNPSRVIAGPVEIRKRLKTIYGRNEELNGFDCEPEQRKEVESLYEQWEMTIEEFLNPNPKPKYKVRRGPKPR